MEIWVISCDSNRTLDSRYIKPGSMILTKLSNYYPYLFSKNIALIKVDVEGTEGRATESVYGLLSKYHVYHVPFIISEFSPNILISYENYIKMYINNRYKIYIKGFSTDKYDNLETVINNKQRTTDLLFIYKDYTK